MSKLLHPESGSFWLIPLEDGTFGYGRAINDLYMAFYHYQTAEPSSELDEIARHPVMFKLIIRLFDSDDWVNLGTRPLEGEVAEPVVFFRQRLGDFKTCFIWDSITGTRSATPEECVGLERTSVWDAPLIAERLLDTLMGRPNEAEIRSRVRFKEFGAD